MAKDAKKQTERSGGSERAFRLGAYYRIVAVFTLIAAVAYGALYYARSKGYQLIHPPTLYWAWFALIIGIILLIGKFIANLPKKESTRRSVRISVGIVTLVTIFVSYVVAINQIDNGFRKYATLTSPDGAHEVVVMRMDTKIPTSDGQEPKVYTAYGAYEKLNRFFCKNDPANLDFIILDNDPDARLDYDWSGNTITLSTTGNATEGSGSLSFTVD